MCAGYLIPYTGQSLFAPGGTRHVVTVLEVAGPAVGRMVRSGLSTAAEAPARRNVILIVADDLGFQIGAYGDKVAKTPGLDRLASTGTRFTRAHCTTASCSASRSVLMTGLHNHATGHYGHAHDYHHFSTYFLRSQPASAAGEGGLRDLLDRQDHLAPDRSITSSSIATTRFREHATRRRWSITPSASWRRPKTPFFLYFCSSDPIGAADLVGSGTGMKPKSPPTKDCETVTFDPQSIVVPPGCPTCRKSGLNWLSIIQAINRFDQGSGPAA